MVGRWVLGGFAAGLSTSFSLQLTGDLLPKRLDGREYVGLLHQHERAADQRALPHEVNGVIVHRRQHGQRSGASLRGGLPRERDAKRQSRAVAHVWVVAFSEERH